MGRLIDAEQAKLMLSELLEVAEKENFTAEDAINHAYEWVDNLPTAYDVERVAEDLQKASMIIEQNENSIKCAIEENMAVHIVKRGGVE